jgi:hypothetical protein
MNLHRPLTLTSVPSHIEARNVIDYDVYNDHRYTDAGDLHVGLQSRRGIWLRHLLDPA